MSAMNGNEQMMPVEQWMEQTSKLQQEILNCHSSSNSHAILVGELVRLRQQRDLLLAALKGYFNQMPVDTAREIILMVEASL